MLLTSCSLASLTNFSLTWSCYWKNLIDFSCFKTSDYFKSISLFFSSICPDIYFRKFDKAPWFWKNADLTSFDKVKTFNISRKLKNYAVNINGDSISDMCPTMVKDFWRSFSSSFCLATTLSIYRSLIYSLSRSCFTSIFKSFFRFALYCCISFFIFSHLFLVWEYS